MNQIFGDMIWNFWENLQSELNVLIDDSSEPVFGYKPCSS